MSILGSGLSLHCLLESEIQLESRTGLGLGLDESGLIVLFYGAVNVATSYSSFAFWSFGNTLGSFKGS